MAHHFGSFTPLAAAAGLHAPQHQQQQAVGSCADSQPPCGDAGACGEADGTLAVLQQQLQLAEVRADGGRNQACQSLQLRLQVGC